MRNGAGDMRVALSRLRLQFMASLAATATQEGEANCDTRVRDDMGLARDHVHPIARCVAPPIFGKATCDLSV